MSTPSTIEMRYRLQRSGFELDIDLELPLHGIAGVFGASGAGKTTLLRCIAGLESAAAARLVVAGDTWEDSEKQVFRAVHERRIGYVFQEPRLFDHLSVQANIEYGAKRRRHNTHSDFDHVIELLGLESLLARRPAQLSGGEAQRVAIARALQCAPRFVLMDEPLASLDQARRDEILPFLDRLHGESAVPILYVSHNIDETCRLCDYLAVIDNGAVVASGDLQDVLVQPDVPMLDGENAGSVIEGVVAGYDASDALTTVAFSGGELLVPGRHGGDGARLRIRIRASDVSLCRELPGQTTILNVLPARVEAIQAGQGPSMLVRLALGDDRIMARITRRSIRELGLREGDELFAQIKSVAVKPTA